MFNIYQKTDIESALLHAPKQSLTDRYHTINSVDVVQKLASNNINLIGTSIANTRKESNEGYQKHIMLFNTGYSANAGNDITLLVTNSYNGSSSLQFNLGVYRAVCANGLVVGNDYMKERIIHKGKDVDSNLHTILEDLPSKARLISDSVEHMTNTDMRRS